MHKGDDIMDYQFDFDKFKQRVPKAYDDGFDDVEYDGLEFPDDASTLDMFDENA